MRGARREDILAHSLALFAEHGPHQVSTRQIAQAVGISQPSLYAHFPSRDAIGVELCCRAFDHLHDRMQATAEAIAEPAGRIREIGRTYIGFGLENEAAYRVAFMLEMPSEDGEQSRVLAAGLRAFGVLRSAFDALPLAPDQRDLALAARLDVVAGRVLKG